MKPNRIKQLWLEGRSAVNGWLSIGNPFTAEIMLAAGYDSITIDIQHGVVDYQTMVAMMQALGNDVIAPMVRVPWLEAGGIMKALDAGAYGIICPMINSRAEAELLVSYMRYPPAGTRSFGPTRANFSCGGNYAAEADNEILCFAMIETAQAMANLDSIVATPGLDGVYIGPADLTLGLTGRRYPTGFDRQEPEMVDAINRIIASAHGAGIRVGLHNGSPAYAAKAIGWGCDLVTVSNDVRLLAGAAQASVGETRRLVSEQAAAKTTSGIRY